MTNLYSDVRFALHLLRKSSALCLAVATLSLGIGATPASSALSMPCCFGRCRLFRPLKSL